MKHLFNEEIISYQKTDLGLTNDTYVVQTTNHQYFVRIPKKELNNLFNRQLEKQIDDKMNDINLTIPTLYFDITTGIKISPFISNLKTYKECSLPNKLQLVSNTLKKLHQLNTTCGTKFIIEDKFNNFKKETIKQLYPLDNYYYLFEIINNFHYPLTICHNDCVDGNFVFKDNQIYLIDYEYSCDNTVLFDLTSFITENEIEDQNVKDQFYSYYFNDEYSHYQKDIIIYEAIHHLLWCQWANMMFDKFNDNIYLHIAQYKYQMLVKVVSQID